MCSKKKVRNVRNVLESPFHVLWSENTNEETSVLQDLLRELLPCAKLKETALKHKTKLNRETKNDEVKKKEENIYRKYLAPGFQSVIRGLEKKELCCCIMSAEINPVLIQRVILTYAQANQIPVVILPGLKNITKKALGFATMVLGVKNIVAESPENRFFPIYKMVSLAPTHIETSLVPRTNEYVDSEQQSISYCRKHVNVPKENKVKYLYREKTNERVFIPENKIGRNNHSTLHKLEEFISFGESHQTRKAKLEDMPSKGDQAKEQYTHFDDMDDVDSEDDENMFFIDDKPDTKLLTSTNEIPDSSKEIKHSVNKSNNNHNRTKVKQNKTNIIGISHKFTAESSSKPGEHSLKNAVSKKKTSKKTSPPVNFKALRIKTVTSNSKKKKRNKNKIDNTFK